MIHPAIRNGMIVIMIVSMISASALLLLAFPVADISIVGSQSRGSYHCSSSSSSSNAIGCKGGFGFGFCFFASAFAPLSSHGHLSQQQQQQKKKTATTRSSFLSRLEAASSSKPSNRGNNNNNININTNTNAKNTKSSVGRLRFCYKRLEMKCPSDDYLRETPSLVIAADLQNALSSCTETTRPLVVPEEMCIAVLDAYMVAYRDAKKKKGDSNNAEFEFECGADAETETNTQLEQQQHYSKEKMDAIVNGMLSTISIMNQHDTNANHQSCCEARTVDPYATILHMLLELTLDSDGDVDGDDSDTQQQQQQQRQQHSRSSHWAATSLEVLSSLESNPLLTTTTTTTTTTTATNKNNNSKQRVVQYNKVLKGLVAAGSGSEDNSTTPRVAVQLLDRMCGNVETSEDGDGNGTIAKATVTIIATALTNLTIGPGIAPDAKSFATVLGSTIGLEKDDAKRLIGASIDLGVYEGYLETVLKRTFGEEQLAEFLR